MCIVFPIPVHNEKVKALCMFMLQVDSSPRKLLHAVYILQKYFIHHEINIFCGLKIFNHKSTHDAISISPDKTQLQLISRQHACNLNGTRASAGVPFRKIGISRVRYSKKLLGINRYLLTSKKVLSKENNVYSRESFSVLAC